MTQTELPDPAQEPAEPDRQPTAAGESCLVYVGTYTERGGPEGGRSGGIHMLRMDLADGRLTLIDVTAAGPNPSYIAIHPSGRFLYCVNEVEEFDGQPGGGVSAFVRDPQTGRLAAFNLERAHGSISCHISIDAAGRYALVANYGSGNVAVLPLGEDGRLLPASDVVGHQAHRPGPDEKTGARAHWISLDPQQRFVLAADLGIDAVIVYRFDHQQGKLLPHAMPGAQTANGAGPRHMAFHPGRQYVYLINELNATLTAFAYDAQAGALHEFQTLSTLPEGYAGPTSCAAVRVAPSGKFVYGSNRGHDSIAVFAVDQASGRLSPAGHQSTLGSTPRDFDIDPSGAFLLAANQDSNNLVTFRIDADTGQLSPTGHSLAVPAPANILFSATNGPTRA
jgi:6-phosphogluconolactonase